MVDGKIVTSPRCVVYDQELESLVQQIEPRLAIYMPNWVNRRWVALRLLEGEFNLLNHIPHNALMDYPRGEIKEDGALCLL